MVRWLLSAFICLAAVPVTAWAADPTLTFKTGDRVLTLTTPQLLARPDVVSITVPKDVAYGRTMHYRAVPMVPLITEAKLSLDEPIEIKALDGFVAQFPAGLFKKGRDAAEPYLAIELPDEPWPTLPGKTQSAGPFYVVWLNPQASGISPEYWPYQVASFENVEDPRVRWPQIDLASTVPQNDPARRGLSVFIENCFACHTMNGGGESTLGPDLNMPMSPTEYFQPEALRLFLRDPEAVRSWPGRTMTGFEVDALSDEELDDLIAYLKAMAKQRG